MNNPTGSPSIQANFHGGNVAEAYSRVGTATDEMKRHRDAAEAAEERIAALPRREHGTRLTTAIGATVLLAFIDWPAMFVTAQATRATTFTGILLIAAAGTALNSALGWQIGWHLRRRRDADAPTFETWFTGVGFVALVLWLGLLFAVRASATATYGLNPWILAGLLTMFAAVVALLSIALGYGIESKLVSDTRSEAARHWRLWRAAKKDLAEHKPDYDRAVHAAEQSAQRRPVTDEAQRSVAPSQNASEAPQSVAASSADVVAPKQSVAAPLQRGAAASASTHVTAEALQPSNGRVSPGIGPSGDTKTSDS